MIKKIKNSIILFIGIQIIVNILDFFKIYPVDFFNTTIEKIEINYTWQSPCGEDAFFIYTDDDVYINRDSFIMKKFNSHDIHRMLLNKIKNKKNRNEKIVCSAIINGKVNYWPMSTYRNIISLNCDS